MSHDPELLATEPLERPFEPLRWIGAYKIAKGVLSLVAGLLVLKLLHRDLPALAEVWMADLHIKPDSWIGHIILHRVVGIRGRSLEWIAVFLFAYVPLTTMEGIGLILRKVWAEWITVIATVALIPVEIHEIIRRVTYVRITILVLNILVAIYIIVRLRRHYLKNRPAPAADFEQNTNLPLRAPESNAPG